MRREDVEAFLVERQDVGMRPATLSQRFRSLQQFFKWLAAEGRDRGQPDGDDATAPCARYSPTRPPRSRAPEAARRLRRDRLRGPPRQRDDPALPSGSTDTNLILHVVDGPWRFAFEQRVAPRLVAVLDLLDDDERTRRVAKRALNGYKLARL